MKKAEYYGIDISILKPGDIITEEDLKTLYEKISQSVIIENESSQFGLSF